MLWVIREPRREMRSGGAGAGGGISAGSNSTQPNSRYEALPAASVANRTTAIG